MIRSTKPLEIVVYQDVLCAWSYVATERLHEVRRTFGTSVRWSFRPYALRVKDAHPTKRELHQMLTGLQRAKKEPEGSRLCTDLWLKGDTPASSLPALVALEAARLQGEEKREALAVSLQRAALELGVNVARPDVLLEIASAHRLDMNRYVAALRSQQTRRLVLKEHQLATRRGVKGVPTLVLGGKWMLSGLREVREYREHILACIHRRDREDLDPGGESVLH